MRLSGFAPRIRCTQSLTRDNNIEFVANRNYAPVITWFWVIYFENVF